MKKMTTKTHLVAISLGLVGLLLQSSVMAAVAVQQGCLDKQVLAHKYERLASSHDKSLKRQVADKRYEQALSSLARAEQNLILAASAYQSLINQTSQRCQALKVQAQKALEVIANRKRKIKCHESVTYANIAFLSLKSEDTLEKKYAYIKALRRVEKTEECQGRIRSAATRNIQNHTRL